MASIVALTGFEYGTAAGIASGTASSKIFDVLNGSVSVVGAAARSGSYGLRVALTAANRLGWDTNTLGTSKTALVFSAYFKLSTDATDNATVMCVDTAATTNALEFIYRPATDDMSLWSNVSNSEVTSSGVTLTSGNWYRLDVRINVAANPWVIDWKINGVTQTQFSPASAATTIARYFLGTQTVFTGTCDYDDVVVSTTTADYPLDQHKVQLLSVDPAGTVTLSGTTTNFSTFASNGTLTAWNATTARNNVDEVPPTIGASADGWVQTLVAANDYVEMPMTTYTLQSGESVTAGRMVACGWAASTTTAFLGFKSWNGTTERLLIDGATYDPNFDNSTTTPGWAAKMLTTADIDTQSELDALAFRVGYSGDATPDIGIHAIYAEIAILVPSSTNAAAENVAVTATAETPSVTVSPPSESVGVAATANDPVPAVKPNAENVAVSATANDIQGTNISSGIESVGVLATANDAAPSVKVNAECATVSAVAGDATVSTVGNTNAQAESVDVSVTANQPTLSVTTPAESVGITVTAETPSTSVKANAEVAVVSADSLNSAANIQSSADLSQVTAVANDITARIAVTSEAVSVLAEALQPTIQTGSFTNANAEVATISVVANNPSGSVNATSETVGVSVTPGDASSSVYVTAGCAEVTVSANPGNAQISAAAELAAAAATVNDSSITTASSVFAECALVGIAAWKPTASTVVPDPDLIIYKRDNRVISHRESGVLIIVDRTNSVSPGG